MHPLQNALSAIHRDALDDAMNQLSAYLEENPRDFQALQLMGIVLRRLGRPEEAIECLQASLDVEGRQPNVLNNLGITLASIGDLEGAKRSYTQALAIDPKFADAAYNLALLHLESKGHSDAEILLQQVCELQPLNHRSFEALSIVQSQLGKIGVALSSAQRAVQLSPRTASCHYQLGKALMASGDFKAAANAFKNSVLLNGELDFGWIGLGNALRSLGDSKGALSAYQASVNANPSNPDAHRLVNEMLWQIGQAKEYLCSYPLVLRSRPEDHRLRLAYAEELIRINRHDDALSELEKVISEAPHRGIALDAIARVKSLGADFECAEHFHSQAILERPDNPLFLRNYAETLLKAKNHYRALQLTREGMERFPNEQGVLALHTTALRLVGDENYGVLANYSDFIKTLIIQPPENYADIDGFFGDLGLVLHEMHTTKAHPTDQTVRGGTQTFGSLFLNQNAILQDAIRQIKRAVHQYVSELPKDPHHPFLRRASSSFEVAGSWSVNLAGGGFHTNHFHPAGWISSALYVSLPSEGSFDNGQAGGLKFGETGLGLGDREVIHRVIRPEIGHLVLFPSYFWHGTVPFQGAGSRLTIAFDVVPT